MKAFNLAFWDSVVEMSLHERFCFQRKRLETVFENHAEKEHNEGLVSSKLEERCFKIAKETFQNVSSVKKADYNVFISGFEADMLITHSDGAVTNIELDGPTHLRLTKQRFCKLRDKVLEQKLGVPVVRWSYELINRMSKEQMREAFKALANGVVNQRSEACKSEMNI